MCRLFHKNYRQSASFQILYHLPYLRLDPKFDVGLKRNFSLVLVARTYYTEDIVKYLSLLNRVLLTYLIYRGCPAIGCYVC